jgi:hypothetical protein
MPNYMLDAMQGYKFVNDINRQDERDKMLEQQHTMAMDREQRAVDQDSANKNVAKVKTEAALMGLGIGKQPQQAQPVQQPEQQNPIYQGWNQVLGKYGIDPNSEQGAAATGKVQHLLNDTEARVQALSLNDSIKKSLSAGGLPPVKDLAAYMNIMGHNELNQRGGADGLQRSVHGVYPGPDGKTAVIEFEVTRPDGSKYLAPATTGKSADPKDDNVQQFPVQDLLKWFAGSTDALKMTLEAEAAAGRTDTIDRYRAYQDKQQGLNDQVTVKNMDDYASDGKNLVSKNEYLKMSADQRARFVPLKQIDLNQKSATLGLSQSNAAADKKYREETFGLHKQQAEAQMAAQGIAGQMSQMQLDALKEEQALFKEYNDPATPADRKKAISEYVRMKKGKAENDGTWRDVEEYPIGADGKPELMSTPARTSVRINPDGTVTTLKDMMAASKKGGGGEQPLTANQITKIETRISAEKDPERKKAMQEEYNKMKGVK